MVTRIEQRESKNKKQKKNVVLTYSATLKDAVRVLRAATWRTAMKL